MRRPLLALVIPAFLAACAGSPNRPVTEAQLGTLAQGQTTRAAAYKILGKPSEMRSNREGMQMVYAWRPAETAERREVVLSFDGGEVLRNIERTEDGSVTTATSASIP